jgi:decaprenyl-phosphate phosphoribosyltransferase
VNFQNYIALMRPKHYLKNLLVFLPLVFSGMLLNKERLITSILAFISFSLVASAVYIINDIRDKDQDEKHPKKRLRPIASGAVSRRQAIILACLLLIVAAAIQYVARFSLLSVGLLLFYVAINLAYSYGLKNIPVLDVAILSLGFVLRVFYGGEAVGIGVSNWLYLSVLAFSFFLSLGKRRNELITNGIRTRKVNQFYTKEFLDKNMYVCLGLTLVYYSLWAIDPTQKHKLIFLTVPVVIAIAMTYSLAIESGESDGDPISVVLGNKPLLALVGLYSLLVLVMVYI